MLRCLVFIKNKINKHVPTFLYRFPSIFQTDSITPKLISFFKHISNPKPRTSSFVWVWLNIISKLSASSSSDNYTKSKR